MPRRRVSTRPCREGRWMRPSSVAERCGRAYAPCGGERTVANERILVVDDEKLIRMSLVEELTRQGFRVFEAETGGAGLQRAAQGDIDLILLDYRLPDMDGLSVLGELAQKFPETLVI